MTLDEYLSLVAQHSLEYDRTFALRSYQEYIKSSSADEHIDIHQYIQQYLPPEDMVNLSSVLGTSYSPEHLLHITKAQKWLQRNCEPYIATLCGVYITTATAQTLREFLCNTIPVMDVFKTLCSELAIIFTQALFENYCQKNKTQLLYTRYHPFYSDKWFWTGKIDDLHTSIRQWYMLYSANIPSDIDGFASLMDAANMLSLGPEQLLTWLLTHPTAYQCHNNRCYINISTIDNLSCRWKDVYKVQPIVNKKLSQIPIKARPGAKQMLLCWLENSNHDWLLPAGFFPQQLENILYTDQLSAASCALDMCLNTYPTRQLSCLKDVTGMPLKKLQEKASSGSIIAFKDDNGNWYISENEYKRVATAQEQHISLDNIILSLLNEINSNYDLSSHVKRNHLMNYCNDHNWWELEYTSCDMLPIDGQRFGIAIAAESVDFLKEKLDLWLKGYGQTYDYKFGLIINKFSHSLPDTAKQLINFEKQVHPADKALVDTAEHLCSILQTDIQKPDDPKIESTIIEPFAQNASLVSCEILTEFLMFAGYNTKRQFHFPKSGRLMETSAYPVNDFAIMMAHIVNDDVIRGKKLIQKAIANKRHADLWLYVAVHMFASWRNTDYRQMIPPKLPYPPTEVLQKISDGEISPAELKTIAEYFIATNSLALDVPNKNQRYHRCPKSVFLLPAILLRIIWHHPGNNRSSLSNVLKYRYLC